MSGDPPSPEAVLPSGTVTFLLTDIEGSTRLWERSAASMSAAVERHDALLGDRVAAHGGVVLKSRGEGDSLFAVFERASDAVACALDAQLALRAEAWPEDSRIRVRMAVHTGEAEQRGGDYYGAAISRCARLRAIAHGGQTLTSRATHDLVAGSLPDGASLRDLGSHRLRDLARPERVHELRHPGLPEEFPPPRSLTDMPHNLPVQLTSFVGREREIDEVRRLLTTTRLLTLTGTGGTGKTRLALQAAAASTDDHPDGVWLVELAALADPALVPRAAAAALGAREQPGLTIEAALVERLKPAEALLVLDNCEHLVAACADLARMLLESCPALRMLATSREPLGVPGEAAWAVPPLTAPGPDDPPAADELVRYEATRLFCDRASTRRATLSMTPETVRAVASICRRLDGIPLAIELAAARVNVLTPVQIDERLEDRFRLLSAGARTAPARHRTLRGLVDWSHDLLDEAHRALLRRLAVFPGSFGLEAAEAVCEGAGDVLEGLAALVDRSLVSAEERDEGLRYRMLETVRLYALERLAEAGESDAVHARHVRWCIQMAERAEPMLTGAGQADALERLEAEHDNLRRALDWGVASEPDQALRLAGALWRFWLLRGHLTEGRDRLARALADSSAHDVDGVWVGKALTGAGVLANVQGDYAAARAQLEQSVAVWRAAGERAGLASAVGGLGAVAQVSGDYAAARACYEEALALEREAGNRSGEAVALSNLGNVAFLVGDLGDARRLYDEGLTAARAAGSAGALMGALNNLGAVALVQGDLDAAGALFEETLAIARDLGDRATVALSLLNLCELATYEDRPDAARAAGDESLAIAEELGDRRCAALALCRLGEADAVAGDPERARELLDRALVALTELGDRAGMAACWEGLGSLALERGEAEPAARFLGAADAAREALASPLPVPALRAADAVREALRAALPPDVLERARAEGRAMALEPSPQLL